MEIARQSNDVKVGVDEASLRELAELPLNGRQVCYHDWHKLLSHCIRNDNNRWRRSRIPSALQ
jgi:hypothetical protein